MLWHLELAVELALLVRLCFVKDGRKWFQCLIGADLLSQCLQMASERLSLWGLGSHVWYIGVAFQAVLIPLALKEAALFWRLSGEHRANMAAHCTLLFWWIGITFGLAWVRIFPYTGTALLIVNTLAFAAWFLMSIG